ncbi:MAG: hypothetical protein WBN68_18975 [Sedimenticolaceae bacterium]
MKNIAIATAIALSSGVAFAAPHNYQLQVGSSELDPSIWEGPELVVKDFEPSKFKDSLAAVYELSDLDEGQPFPFVGTIVPSGPTRISLYEAYRDTPEGTAYRDYYERFPADTNWSAVAESSNADPNNI